MIPNDNFALISSLDLDPIKTKVMHKESGEGWSLQYANAVEIEYRRFLYLTKAFPNEQLAPTEDVDTFWHYHILDTMKYARDCQEVFGYFVHHYPYLGLVGENGLEMRQQSGDRMRELYESSFGESFVEAAGVLRERASQEAMNIASYDRAQAAWCGVVPSTKAGGTQAAWCGVASSTKAAGAQTAWCGVVPSRKAGSAEAAFPELAQAV